MRDWIIEVVIVGFMCTMFMLPTGEITCVCEEQPPQQIEQQQGKSETLERGAWMGRSAD